jgi:hypothetical protein
MRMINKYSLSLIIVSMILVSCSKRRIAATKDRIQYSAQKTMWVTDKDYYLDDTIIVHLAVPHPKELAIRTPSGGFYYLVYPKDLHTIPQGKPMYSVAEFQKINKLVFSPGKSRGNPHDVQFKGNQLIFKKSGTYELLMSENLSTDDGTPFEKLIIHYIHENKPPRV